MVDRKKLGPRIKRLRELLSAATPGDWAATEVDGTVYIDADDSGDHPIAMIMSGSPHSQDRADAALISEMKRALPLILDALSSAVDDDKGATRLH
ncbi:hypothetical protein QP178_09825 [Sphingomonas aurantiaca]|uniref:hypothetical protein n=1 Tax=Sphingomonas TaxID=13687 RepID=UPI0011B263B6|nr:MULTISPECIES: hypothetical protein [Sphingomonas]